VRVFLILSATREKMQLLALLLLACLLLVQGFAPRPTFGLAKMSSNSIGSSSSSSSALLAKGKGKEPAPALAPDGTEYWQGDWVCADCGYIYDIDIDGGGLYFEQQKRGFICPQCSAPRKRYAKKVGDQWGVTRDGGDLPIYAWTFVGLAATTWFALVYVPQL